MQSFFFTSLPCTPSPPPASAPSLHCAGQNYLAASTTFK
jgi:hypothetical protein